jgi:hypothetical protein
MRTPQDATFDASEPVATCCHVCKHPLLRTTGLKTPLRLSQCMRTAPNPSAHVRSRAVYLLDELAADAQSGMPEVGLVVDFCVKRLTARPPVVKQKVADAMTTQGDAGACALNLWW